MGSRGEIAGNTVETVAVAQKWALSKEDVLVFGSHGVMSEHNISTQWRTYYLVDNQHISSI